ncbi:nagb/rpia/CoA transferase-like protein [Sporormia fimetaria CBS 119925]|uniref:Nagb/rpia/CoA transferase-like protein n=1 Tax=Sporormia fimetaria CBS 119925 TaxID=1340428 RepID=A0A6A6VIU0_9PLEO|nr:nagb/rpia/CoA transferase-like protein [Sporormia fimetaria CBS 119925]
MDDNDDNNASPSSTHTRTPLLQPILYNPEFYAHLESCTDTLKNDFKSGAREMAAQALQFLGVSIEMATITARNMDELWVMAVGAGKQLCEARPSMNAATTSCILHSLESIQERWHDMVPKSMDELAQSASARIDEILKERKETDAQLGRSVTFMVKKLLSETDTPTTTRTQPHLQIHILTLSNSSTIRNALLSLLANIPTLHLQLTILESRPRLEGASLAAQLLDNQEVRPRLHVTLAPDCAVGSLMPHMDLVLLGADRIAPSGATSNKIGSLAAAATARLGNPNPVPVAVISDAEKIGTTEPEAWHRERESHPREEVTGAYEQYVQKGVEGCEVFGEWFESVPGWLIKWWVCEKGVWGTKEVKEWAEEVKGLEWRVFGRV